ncbi:MAG: 2-dehydropantoate 2-reductase N-terminal domain-containing protein, partial [Candidatus Margulisiibacteriota bacterium]
MLNKIIICVEPRIAIAGAAGVIGSLVRITLEQQGLAWVTGYDSDKEIVQIINNLGMQVVRDFNGQLQVHETTLADHLEGLQKPIKYLIVSVKRTDTATVIKEAIPYLNKDSVIVLTQNGVDFFSEIPQELMAKLPTKKIVVSTVALAGTKFPWQKVNEPNEFVRVTFGGNELVMAPHPVLSKQPGGEVPAADLNYLKEKLQGQYVKAQVVSPEEFMPIMHNKFVLNCAVNPLSAIFGQSIGEAAKDPLFEKLFRAVITETIFVLERNNMPVGKMKLIDMKKFMDPMLWDKLEAASGAIVTRNAFSKLIHGIANWVNKFIAHLLFGRLKTISSTLFSSLAQEIHFWR